MFFVELMSWARVTEQLQISIKVCLVFFYFSMLNVITIEKSSKMCVLGYQFLIEM